MTSPELAKPVDTLNAFLDAGEDPGPVLDDLLAASAIPQWVVFDEDNPDTFPDNGRWGDSAVLGLSIVTKLNHRKADGSPALFYEAHFGQYVTCDDGQVRFLLDSGQGYCGEPGEEGEDWVQPPRLWTYLVRPDQVMEVP